MADLIHLELARRTGGPVVPFDARGRRSRRLGWFGDVDRLVVVSTGDVGTADLALAHGLAWAGDRHLRLILSAGTEQAALERAAFLSVEVEVWTHAPDGTVSYCDPLTRANVLARFAEELRGQDLHDLGQGAEWVDALVSWADSAPGLIPAHRQSYLAWQCHGRRVLRIQRRRGGLVAQAGKHWGTPPPGEPEAVTIDLTTAATPAQTMGLIAAAARASADRLTGADSGHGEHAFQSTLSLHPRAFGWRDLRREFPARRAGGRTGYVDFLAVDGQHRLRVVETKLGGDDQVGLQALDYAIWATANQTRLAAAFDLATVAAPVIDLVTGPGGDGSHLGPYTAAQLEAIDGSIGWQVWHVEHGTDWSVTTPGRRRLAADTPRFVDARWRWRLQTHLVDTVGADRYPSPAEAMEPAAAAACEQLPARGAAHPWLLHVRSSQAFALRLFAPLDDHQLAAVTAAATGVDVATVDSIDFEWSDPEDRLHEVSTPSPHTTTVDVAIRARDTTGALHLVLVEVKLSEEDFGGCSAWPAPGNDALDVCARPGPFGGDPDRCFQLRNKDRGPRRRYDTALNLTAPAADTAAGDGAGGCWWRFGGNQPMRNAALAAALVAAGEADAAHVVLCAPTGHQPVWRRWRQVTDRLADVPGVRFGDLPAHHVAALGPHSDTLANHYLLDG